MKALATWCYRHRLTVLALWVAVLAVLGGSQALAGTGYENGFALPGTDSTKAVELLTAAFPAQSGESSSVVWHVEGGTVRDAAVKDRVTAMLDQVAHAPSVTAVGSPYTERGATQISADGRTAYATVSFRGKAADIPPDDVRHVIDLARHAGTDRLEVELGGQIISQVNGVSTGSSELIGIVAAAVILLIAFGSVLSMLLPIITAVVSLVAALISVGLLSHAVAIPNVAPTIAALIGLGVGIDYALFIVTRHRDGLKAGLSVQESAVRAVNTSGRAVIFAGLTVAVAMLGMMVTGLEFLTGVGVAASVTVGYSVLAAITLLPALLRVLGPRVLSRRERARLAQTSADAAAQVGQTGFWARWARLIERRSVLFVPVALLVMAVLSMPTLSIRIGQADQGNDPSSTTTRKAYDLLAQGFGPGFNGPLQLVAPVRSDDDKATLAALVKTVAAQPGVAAAVQVPTPPGSNLGLVQVVPATAPQDAETTDLIQHLRSDVIPKAVAGHSLSVYVGGVTAIFVDFADVLNSKLPLFLGVIIGLGFLLLMLAFRSVVVPATAAVMNLLAAAASFGVVVAVFQWGWGSEMLGLGKAGPIEAFLPVMMIAILFGLSMDYQVFLVSRMHEEWVHGGDNRRAVTIGQALTGRIITAAASIMIFVFGAFIFGGERVVAEFGVGLASAVAIDAFVLRTVLVPAAMHLFGRSNWWLPGWIDRWLPHLSVEPAEDAAPAARSEAVEQAPAATH